MNGITTSTTITDPAYHTPNGNHVAQRCEPFIGNLPKFAQGGSDAYV